MINIILPLNFGCILIYVAIKFYLKQVGKKELLTDAPPPTVLGRPTYLRFGKSKSFDSEAQINNSNTTPYNVIHPTKCFDCEKQINQNYNGLPSNMGHSTKCFTCEGGSL